MFASQITSRLDRESSRLKCAVGLLAFVLALSSSPGAQSLRDVLSPEDFAHAGLAKLTDAELEFLSARLLPPPAAVAAAGTRDPAVRPDPRRPDLTALPQGEAAFGREDQVRRTVEQQQRVPDTIQSPIAGRFSGWSGRTTFTLANGQVWQQAEPGDFAVTLDAPMATIRKGRFGAFFFGVAGYGSEVKVKRVK